jgi:hypothetical protein
LPVLILGFATPNPNDGKAIDYYSQMLSAVSLVGRKSLQSHLIIGFRNAEALDYLVNAFS